MSLRILQRYWKVFGEKVNILLSFAYVGSDFSNIVTNCRHMVKGLVLDSGAWSVATGVADLSLQNYMAFTKLHGHRFDRYFNFDTDFSDSGFDHNVAHQLIMEREGLSPVPVVHNLFDGEIDYYVQSGRYDYLALGSSQTTNYDDLAYGVHRIKKAKEDMKIHWFGGGRYDWLSRLPITSCDTSSWASLGKFGFIMYWNQHQPGPNKADKIYVSGTVRPVKEDEFLYTTYPWREELDRYIFTVFGLTFHDLCAYEGAFNMQLINTRFYAEMEKRINEERTRRGIALE